MDMTHRFTPSEGVVGANVSTNNPATYSFMEGEKMEAKKDVVFTKDGDYRVDISLGTIFRIQQSLTMIDFFKRNNDYSNYYREIVDTLMDNVVVFFVKVDKKTGDVLETPYAKRIKELRKIAILEFQKCEYIDSYGTKKFVASGKLIDALRNLDNYIRLVLDLNNFYIWSSSDTSETPAIMRKPRINNF